MYVFLQIFARFSNMLDLPIFYCFSSIWLSLWSSTIQIVWLLIEHFASNVLSILNAIRPNTVDGRLVSLNGRSVFTAGFIKFLLESRAYWHRAVLIGCSVRVWSFTGHRSPACPRLPRVSFVYICHSPRGYIFLKWYAFPVFATLLKFCSKMLLCKIL